MRGPAAGGVDTAWWPSDQDAEEVGGSGGCQKLPGVGGTAGSLEKKPKD